MNMLTNWYHQRDQKKFQIVCSFDLTAMFDLIDIPILLQKLKVLGANQVTLDFLLSYLSNRRNMTRIGNEISSEIESRRGGPQGASLTSTLALVILSDINLFIEETSLESYCDDNTLTASADSLEK